MKKRRLDGLTMESAGVPEETPAPAPSPVRTRPKLNLKKRDPAAAAAAASSMAPSSGKPNPFGAARPREETLKAKGVDAGAQDTERERKMQAMKNLSRFQKQDADELADVVRRAEEALREANEKEMPENALRTDLEAKRKQLNDLMENFAKINLDHAEAKAAGKPPPGVARSHSGSVDKA